MKLPRNRRSYVVPWHDVHDGPTFPPPGLLRLLLRKGATEVVTLEYNADLQHHGCEARYTATGAPLIFHRQHRHTRVINYLAPVCGGVSHFRSRPPYCALTRDIPAHWGGVGGGGGGGGSRSTGYLSPWWYSHHELSTFEIEKRLGNNGLPPGIQQLLRSRNDSEVTDGCHPECGPNAMPRCVDAVTFSRPLASSWPVTLLLSISAASIGGLSLLHAGVPPHSNVRPSGLGSSCDGGKSALALSLQRRFCRLPPTGAAVWFHTHNLCARTYSA